MQRFNRIGFFVIISGIFAALLYKAIRIPVVTDEAITLNYLGSSFLDIVTYKDHYPNNHILNTLLTRSFVAVAGNSPLVIRLPNLLSFLLYGFGVFRITKSSQGIQSIWFIPSVMLFVANPYLLDFFVMCRGYGISCALAVTSVSYILTGFKNPDTKHIYLALFTAILASYANFTLLVFWIGMSLVALFYFYLNRRDIKDFIRSAIILAFITAAYGAVITLPIIRMQSSNEFQFWTSGGFYKETVLPLILYSSNGSRLLPGPQVIAFMVFLIIAINAGFVTVKLIKKELSILRTPVFLATVILLLCAVINILQIRILNTPNLHGRTALFFYPLTVAMIVSAFSLFVIDGRPRIQFIFAFFLAFICTFHIVDRFKPLFLRDAWYSVHTYEIMDYLKEKHPGQSVSLKTQGSLFHSFNYYVKRGDVPWLRLEPYDGKLDSNTTANYYYLFGYDSLALSPAFKTVQTYPGGMALMENQNLK